MRVVVISVHGLSKIVEVETVEEVQAMVGITPEENWETAIFEGVENVGLIMRDQDLKSLETNRLNVKGTFAIIGMTRTMKGKKIIDTQFHSLEEKQAMDLKFSVTVTTMKKLSRR